jgi:hypothetical protein
MAVNLQIAQDLITTDPGEAQALVSEIRGETTEARIQQTLNSSSWG